MSSASTDLPSSARLVVIRRKAGNIEVLPMTARSRAARRLVLRVHLLDRFARGFPFRVAPFAQVVEIAAGRQRIAPVQGDGLPGAPAAPFEQHKGRGVLK